MEVTITWQSAATAAGVIGALIALAAYFAKAVRWMDRQKIQDEELQTLRDRHDRDIHSVQIELEMLTYGVLACLKGLKEQGCNGPVTEAINKLEGYINKKAHE